jgi:hypothetical protein
MVLTPSLPHFTSAIVQLGTSTSESRHFGKLWHTQLDEVPVSRQHRMNLLLHDAAPELDPAAHVQSMAVSVHDQPMHVQLPEAG